jgi:DNA polymerase I-like protein with 3'-5' exonuclease and polymerase domains
MQIGHTNMFEHLRDKGVIYSLASAEQDFEDHVKKVEKKFWDRFKGVKAWQEKMFKSYLEKGYIEQLFGFRTGGWLSKNDICNYNVQGTAFHCLVWAVNRLRLEMRERAMRSMIVGQIHDCCLSDNVPSESQAWYNLSHRIATKDIRDEFPWIIVPLDVEFERTEIDQPWSTKKEFFPF